ncbi:class F sortase [Paractinoplanes rishiriensis]|uniref:Class F sortase n=1 Tax=Paractinoplanes rishiriensis TaxID=1050105 RepID=A0A919K779_9ACTN|nr:class F sortase [Actinoplanes rishiriensis]GIF00196.1 class F sortase [Actinoplanes rishiriensis]
MPPAVRVPALGVVTIALVATLSGTPPAADRPPPARPKEHKTFRSDSGYRAVAEPVRLRIPDLGIDGKVQRIGRNPDGTIAVPERTDVAGWYRHGPRPGQPGPAVVLGHVDSRDGPGIFLDLSRAQPGSTVRIDRADGSAVSFRITGISRVAKVSFPTDLVYGPTLDPSLRLVTCGGSFDRVRRSYRDNVIAYADQV